MLQSARQWVIDRFALQPIFDGLLNRSVPRVHWYHGDGAVLLTLLGIQVLTGCVLAMTYSPAVDSAYDSVQFISNQQFLGGFVRGMHYWSAGAAVVMVFFHLFRQLLLGGYKAPREGTWLIGVLLFFCILLMAFTGYLLRWDERAIYGIRVMLHMVSRVPWIGHSLVVLVQGGEDLGPLTLTRLYAFHVLIIPLLMFAFTGLHLYLIIVRGTITRTEQERGVSTAEEQKAMYRDETENRGELFFPITMFKEGIFVTLVVTVILAVVVTYGPPQLDPEGNLEGHAMPSEEWWFWWYSGLIALVPSTVAPWFVVLFPALVFLGLMSIPFLDRGPARGVSQRPYWLVTVILLTLTILGLSDYRRRSTFTAWPDQKPPTVPQNVHLTEEAERGRILFAEYGCNSCHAVAGQGRHVAVDFTTLEEMRSFEEMREYIRKPPTDVAMPSYGSRVEEDELAALAAFCHVAQTFHRTP